MYFYILFAKFSRKIYKPISFVYRRLIARVTNNHLWMLYNFQIQGTIIFIRDRIKQILIYVKYSFSGIVIDPNFVL